MNSLAGMEESHSISLMTLLRMFIMEIKSCEIIIELKSIVRVMFSGVLHANSIMRM